MKLQDAVYLFACLLNHSNWQWILLDIFNLKKQKKKQSGNEHSLRTKIKVNLEVENLGFGLAFICCGNQVKTQIKPCFFMVAGNVFKHILE